MMKVYFLRHGVAVDRLVWHGEDTERPLLGLGHKRTKQVALAARRWKLSFERVLTSPALRAQQTAEVFMQHFCTGKRKHARTRIEVDARLSHGFNLDRLRMVLGAKKQASVLLVGHEPDFSQTISELIGGASVVLKKSGLVRVDLEAAPSTRGKLIWLIGPRLAR
jgi:phosphohistidine phosphatase